MMPFFVAQVISCGYCCEILPWWVCLPLPSQAVVLAAGLGAIVAASAYRRVQR